jgi:hypothetical protein
MFRGLSGNHVLVHAKMPRREEQRQKMLCDFATLREMSFLTSHLLNFSASSLLLSVLLLFCSSSLLLPHSAIRNSSPLLLCSSALLLLCSSALLLFSFLSLDILGHTDRKEHGQIFFFFWVSVFVSVCGGLLLFCLPHAKTQSRQVS